MDKIGQNNLSLGDMSDLSHLNTVCYLVSIDKIDSASPSRDHDGSSDHRSPDH